MVATTISSLNASASHIDDLSDSDIGEMLAGGFYATDDPAVLAAADTVVICDKPHFARTRPEAPRGCVTALMCPRFR